MKRLLYLSLFVALTTACSKNTTDVAPDAATTIVGTYEVSTLSQTGAGASMTYALPLTTTSNGVTVTLSGQIGVVKKTESTVGMTLTLKTTGQPDNNQDIGTLEIKGTDLYSGTTKVGTADGTNLSLDAANSDGTRAKVVAKKK